MGFIKKNLQKVIEWRDNSKDIVVYHYPVEDRYEIMTGSTLVVRESQVAVFVHKGKVADVFVPGTYRLSTDNLPVITKLLSIGTGFNSPIKAEVYFVNTKQFIGQKWGTQNPITIRDKDFGMVRIRGFGIYAYKVDDAKIFMDEMFGTNNLYTTSDVAEQIRPMIIEAISDTIAESKISMLDLAANYREFSEKVRESSQAEFKKYGLRLEKLVIENISLPESVEKALDERSKLGIMADKMNTYTQYQAANAMRDAANNPNGNNLAGLGVGLGVAGSVGSVLNGALNGTTTDNNTKTCVKCGAEISVKAKHCPECGAVQSATCPKCGEAVSAKAKFCANCGAKIGTKVDKKHCTECGEELKAGAKFCPNCGKKC